MTLFLLILFMVVGGFIYAFLTTNVVEFIEDYRDFMRIKKVLRFLKSADRSALSIKNADKGGLKCLMRK